MFPIGIDIGYEETKYATVTGVDSFPSAMATNSTDDPLFRTSRQHHVHVTWSDGRVYERLVGEAALRHPEMVQTRAQEKPAEDHDILLFTAAYLAGEEGPFDVGVGLPLGFYRHQEAALAERLRALTATVTVDQGDERRLSIRKVEVYPQGAIILLAQADSLPRNGWVALVDPGGYTTEYILAEMVDGIPNPIKEYSDTIEIGSYRVYGKIAGAWKTKVGVPLPADLATDIYRKALAGEPVTYFGRQYDLSQEAQVARRDTANLIAMRILAAWGNRAGWIEVTLLAGGGPLFFGHHLRQPFQGVQTVKDPVHANATAYLAVLQGSL